MTSEDEELFVASEDDLHKVLDMSDDVLNGMDYLPSCFSEVVSGPGVKAFLYKVKDEVVAFAATKLVDEGQTLIFIASRVKATFRDRGVYSRFRKKIFTHFTDRSQYPHLRREVMTVNVENFGTKEHRMMASGWREICSKQNVLSSFKTSALKEHPLEPAHGEVTALTANHLRDLFQKEPSHWPVHLFPHKHLIVNWKPYAVMADNVHRILNDMHAEFYATKTTTSSSTEDAHEQFSLLSAGTYYPVALGVYYAVDFFGKIGTGGGRRTEVADHLLTHLRRLKEVAQTVRTTGSLVVFSVLSLERLDDVVGQVTRRLKPEKLDWFWIHKTMRVMERELSELKQPGD